MKFVFEFANNEEVEFEIQDTPSAYDLNEQDEFYFWEENYGGCYNA